MVAVRVIKPFRRKSTGEVITAGRILAIPGETLPHMTGYVEPIDTRQLIGEALKEIDAMGRPWPLDFFAGLPEAPRDHLRQLLHDIESAALAKDVPGVVEALNGYRVELMRHVH